MDGIRLDGGDFMGSRLHEVLARATLEMKCKDLGFTVTKEWIDCLDVDEAQFIVSIINQVRPQAMKILKHTSTENIKKYSGNVEEFYGSVLHELLAKATLLLKCEQFGMTFSPDLMDWLNNLQLEEAHAYLETMNDLYDQTQFLRAH